MTDVTTVLEGVQVPTWAMHSGTTAKVAMYVPTSETRRLGRIDWYPDRGQPCKHEGHWFHAGVTETPTYTSLQTLEGVAYQVFGWYACAYHDRRWRQRFVLTYLDGRSVRITDVYAEKYGSSPYDYTCYKYEPMSVEDAAYGGRTMIVKYTIWKGTTDEKFIWPAADFDKLCNAVQNFGDRMMAEPGTESILHTPVQFTLRGHLPPRDAFPFNWKHNEYETYRMFNEFGLLSNSYAAGFTNAYVDMVDDIPRLQSNSIANVIEIMEAISGIALNILGGNTGNALKRGVKNIKDIRNAYLAWRYSYCTTKSDIEEFIELNDRLSASMSDIIHIKGTYIYGDCLYRCSGMVDPYESIPDTSTYKGFMDMYGLNMNIERFWDLVPFSFMIDWFIHLSDWVHVGETLQRDGLQMQVGEVWVSCRTLYDNQDSYMRFKLPGVPQNWVFPAPSNKAVGKKTLFMRISDCISIFSK